MAGLFPKAPGLKAYWRLLRRAEDAVTEVPASHWPVDAYYDGDPSAPDKTYCRRGAFLSAVDFDPIEYGIPPAALEATDTAQLLGLVAAKDALNDAGYGEGGREFDRKRTSVILGVTGTLELVIPLGARLGHPHWKQALHEAGVDEATADDVMRRISASYVPWQESSFPGLLGNVVAGRIANRLDLKGTNCVVDAACASSLSAMHLAVLELTAGKSDLVLTGGVDTLNDIFMFMCFSKTQALSAGGDARPFSADADGTVIGEGVGLVALKRLADAERDGDRIYAVLRGIGSSSDGKSQSIYAPRAAGQAEALRDAYRRAGVAPSTVELVEAHGTGTKVGDIVEFEALNTVFRESRSEGAWCGLGSVKSQIGHTKAAAGAASMLKAVLALHRKVMPATLKVTEPNPKMGIADSPFYVNTQTRPWFAHPKHPRRASISSFGFGGSNFHAVLEEYGAKATEPAWDGSVEIVALSAPDDAQLANSVKAWGAAISGGLNDAEFARRAADSRRAFSRDHRRRLVAVFEKDDDAGERFGAIEAALASGGVEAASRLTRVHAGGDEQPGKLALLFPGQASQYVGMGRDLVCVFPEAHAALAEANGTGLPGERLSDYVFPQPSFDAGVRQGQQAALTRTEIAQPALGAVSLGMLRVLEGFGVKADCAAGHSFGELVALRAAGRIDDATLRKLAAIRGRLMAEGDGDRGTMAAVHAPLDELDALLTDRGLDVVLANRNAPAQGVISGTGEAVSRAMEACKARGWRVSALAVSGAFHSELMSEAHARFRAELNKATIQRGAFPVIANRTAAAYPEDRRDVRALLADQLVQPVRFEESIRGLYADGVRTFVEVGPKRVLSGLVRTILEGEAHATLAMDASSGKGSGLADLAAVLAELAARGHAVELGRWEKLLPEKRKPRMVVPLLGTNYRAERKAVESAPRPQQESVEIGSKKVTKNPSESGVPDASAATSSGAAAPGAPATFAADGNAMAGVFAVVQEGLRAMQALQQQTAGAHQRFLESQEHAHRSFQMVMESQQRLFEKLAGLPVSPVTVAPPAEVRAPTAGAGSSPAPAYVAQPPLAMQAVPVAAPAAAPMPAPVTAPEPTATVPPVSAAPSAAPSPSQPVAPQAAAGGGFEDVLLAVVAELTGYPQEMLELDMDMEADLGIDSIKRVEILAAVQEKRPDLQAVDSSYMGSLRSLRDIIEAMGGSDEAAGGTSAEVPTTENPTEGPSLPAPAQTEAASVALNRQVLTAVDLPRAVERSISIAPGYEIWIVEDGSGLAGALVERFVAQGIAARVVGATPPVDGEACAPVGGLIHLFPPRGADGKAIEDSTDHLKGAFSLTKELGADLRAAADEGGALFATIARMDGAFGLSGGSFDPVHGGLAGLAKTVAQEWPGVHVRALDVDPAWQQVEKLADRIVLELGAEGPVEVGLVKGRRRGLDLADASVERGACFLSKGDVVVVTGGARGVTADCALALAHTAKTAMVLLGRSPEPSPEPAWAAGLTEPAELKRAILQNVFGPSQKPSPSELEAAYRRHLANREVADTLAEIAATGAKAIYRSVDVCDRAALAKVFAEVRHAHGPIRGLIHGAGVIEDRLIDDKDLALFEKVFDTKVAGLSALLDAVGDDSLKALVLFSSVSGRFGRQGQVDYAMANEVLNKVAQREAARRRHCRVVSINWGPWDGGMVTAPLKREFARLGIDLIPRAQGAMAMVDELCCPDRSAVEVLIGGAFPDAAKPQPADAAETSDASLHVVFTRRVDVESHPFLRSHMIGGKGVLPMAVTMEWLAHAALHANPGLVLAGLEELRVCKGVIVEGGGVDLELAASRVTRLGDTFVLAVELRSRLADGTAVLNAKAKAVLADRHAPADQFVAPEGLHAQPYVRDAYREVLFHGEAFQCIADVVGCSEKGIVAHLSAAPAPTAWMSAPPRGAWVGDPLAVDGVLQLGIVWSAEVLGAPSLPNYIGGYRQHVAALPAGGVTAVVQVREATGQRVVADATLLDEKGVVVATLQDCRWTVDASLVSAFGKGSGADAAR